MSRTRTVSVMSSATINLPFRGAKTLYLQQLKKLHRLIENLAGKLVEFAAQSENPLGPHQLLRFSNYRACDGIDSTRTGSPEPDFFSVFSGTEVMASIQALMIAMFMEKSLLAMPS